LRSERPEPSTGSRDKGSSLERNEKDQNDQTINYMYDGPAVPSSPSISLLLALGMVVSPLVVTVVWSSIPLVLGNKRDCAIDEYGWRCRGFKRGREKQEKRRKKKKGGKGEAQRGISVIWLGCATACTFARHLSVEVRHTSGRSVDHKSSSLCMQQICLLSTLTVNRTFANNLGNGKILEWSFIWPMCLTHLWCDSLV
ncbi:unnamed protein product, partial [Trichogramma brassicae]